MGFDDVVRATKESQQGVEQSLSGNQRKNKGAAVFQPVKPEIRRNNLENISAHDDTDDEENANEFGEFGGMRARPQLRKLSTQEVEAHIINHYQFRFLCRYCVTAAPRTDHRMNTSFGQQR